MPLKDLLLLVKSKVCAPQPGTSIALETAAFEWPNAPEGMRIVKRLLDGNRRFVENRSQHAGQDREALKTLVKRQDPDVIVVTCSDSRNSPSIIFDLGLGDLFEIESAGGIVVGKCNGKPQLPSAQLGTIEYMVNQWRTQGRAGVLLILGHTNCGAVNAAINSAAGSNTGSANLNSLVDAVRDNIPEDVRRDPGHCGERAVCANCAAVMDSILSNSDLVRDAVEKGLVFPLQGVFDLESGEVSYVGAVGYQERRVANASI